MANKAPVNNQRKDRASNRKRGNVRPSAEEKGEDIARELRIKPKTKAFYDKILEDPSIKMRDAYKQLHPEASDNTASTGASKLIKSPKYQIYSQAVVGKAKRRIGTLVSSDNESIALKASQDILDRTEGKATQKNESINRTVEVKVDLTGVRLGNHYLTE